MRNLAWLGGVMLALSCTVNSSNLDVDASGFGAGGNAPGAGGATATGGVSASGGAPGSGGQIATGGTTGTGGVTAAGGSPGSGGQIATGGTMGTGGQIVTGGTTGTGGQTATGGHFGTGGRFGTGGQVGSGGQGGGTGRSCSQLENDYSDALVTSKSCTLGATDQCKQLVDSSISCPGCKVYVNDTTDLDAIKARWTDAGCAQMRSPCPAIACVATLPAVCSATSNGPGPGSGATCAMAQPRN
jgi:hypothetical protein